ncbi:undecaprenyldiphospho-muramoylpentapeptide beta-N-acetylglucosaminyltransferase [Geobacter sp. SVR]|uniref:undecaprenyldiphospho-muramoylpentapeptide beta-N-acetylglucosaminyltransferase n=1 Tax=Geobacter sp. SVR TaxID=2495594 RepID=UPI00143EFE47|nr:undecaprenyldiphospho-muramoylpentapeptide beta-N-acetylglucosaminyltransferase [Geobacter sp. SVR]BCS52295.1 UDP-N-acetylglucosamine--N-acetylmuramyl-(pentapeptide) pyrophosphoryl-undecaprenol N-acetylglucosamine transferase [Geobacter sp. SVR]GCF85046.1 UDP-N-acetylglucosamine--N-acetylmuramyl-(pentapeptide) pyrophosphoryl-undecaprenol N-acetylglucosamine transferase [Geobacter sp. SVR]
MRLIIAGGGTGGHLFPGIAVAEEFLSRDPANQVLFVGTERGIEVRAVPAAGYRLELISAAGIRGKGSLSKLKGTLMMLYGYSQSRSILKEFRPDLVLGVGGYASLPMVLASRGMQIPRFIHEQNAIPGMTNKLLARVADRVFITLEESARYFPERNTMLSGNPLRRQILDQAGQLTSEQTGGDGRFRLLVFGGSQGARAINQAMTAALPFLGDRADRIEITHQTGEKEAGEVGEAYRKAGFEASVTPFIHDMASAYQRADLVICRAGATTIAELTACGRPAVFIPFPHAVDDHQRRNAEALLKKGAGFMLLEQELSGERLAETIRELMDAPETLQHTGQAAFALARLDAARVIVDEMEKYREKTGTGRD